MGQALQVRLPTVAMSVPAPSGGASSSSSNTGGAAGRVARAERALAHISPNFNANAYGGGGGLRPADANANHLLSRSWAGDGRSSSSSGGVHGGGGGGRYGGERAGGLRASRDAAAAAAAFVAGSKGHGGGGGGRAVSQSMSVAEGSASVAARRMDRMEGLYEEISRIQDRVARKLG